MSSIRLARAGAIRCANRAGADARPRPHANARGNRAPKTERQGETHAENEEPKQPDGIAGPPVGEEGCMPETA